MRNRNLPDATPAEVETVLSRLPGADQFDLQVTFDTSSARPYIEVVLRAATFEDIPAIKQLRDTFGHVTKPEAHVGLSIGLHEHPTIKIYSWGYDRNVSEYLDDALAHIPEAAPVEVQVDDWALAK